jgi:hypothetical protein
MIKSQTTIERLLRKGWTIEIGCFGGYRLASPDGEKRKPVHAGAVLEAEEAGLIVRVDDRSTTCGETWGLTPSLDAILADSKVETVHDERVPGDRSQEGLGNGIWAYLRTGWRCIASDTHACHEWTVEALAGAVRRAEPCPCPDCLKNRVS